MHQPDELPRRFYAEAADRKHIVELLGLCKGLIADGRVNEDEAIALKVWLSSHPNVATTFPARELAERLAAVFEDGLIDEAELAELQQMVADLVGEPGDGTGNMNRATSLPLNDPAPTVLFEGRDFVFTGNFCMKRRECERLVTDRAGTVYPRVNHRVDYLVIGTIASDAWISSSWGHKIVEAMELRASGGKIKIISEAHWLSALEFGA